MPYVAFWKVDNEEYEANIQIDHMYAFLVWACLHIFKSDLELLDLHPWPRNPYFDN